MAWHDALALSELPDGKPTAVDLEGFPVVLVRDEDEVYACDAVCPHKFGPLAEGTADGCRLTCPLHAGTFDLRTGLPQAGAEWAGQVPVFPTRIRDGRVEVEADF